MAGGVIISNTAEPSRIVGIHGGKGEAMHKRLADGSMLSSDFHMLDFGISPVGTTAGLHVHTRTEEMHYIVSGRGEYQLGEEMVPVRAGDAVLVGLNGQHSVTPLGEEPLVLVIIEASPPEIEALLPPVRPFVETSA